MNLNKLMMIIGYILLISSIQSMKFKIMKNQENDVTQKLSNILSVRKNAKNKNRFKKRKIKLFSKIHQAGSLKQDFIINPIVELGGIFVNTFKKSLIIHMENKLGLNKNKDNEGIFSWKRWLLHKVKEKIQTKESGIKNMNDLKSIDLKEQIKKKLSERLSKGIFKKKEFNSENSNKILKKFKKEKKSNERQLRELEKEEEKMKESTNQKNKSSNGILNIVEGLFSFFGSKKNKFKKKNEYIEDNFENKSYDDSNKKSSNVFVGPNKNENINSDNNYSNNSENITYSNGDETEGYSNNKQSQAYNPLENQNEEYSLGPYKKSSKIKLKDLFMNKTQRNFT